MSIRKIVVTVIFFILPLILGSQAKATNVIPNTETEIEDVFVRDLNPSFEVAEPEATALPLPTVFFPEILLIPETPEDTVYFSDRVEGEEVAAELAEKQRKKEEKRRKEKERRRKEAERKRRIAKEKKRRARDLKVLKKFYDSLSVSNTDMSKRLGISKKFFKEIMESLTCDYVGFFRENADTHWEIAKKYDLNEFLLPSVNAKESLWGQCQSNKNNFSGQRIEGNKYYSYDSVREGIEATAKNLSENYLRKDGKFSHGNSLKGINEEYCEPRPRKNAKETKEELKYSWANGVCGCMKRIIGDYLNLNQ